MIHHISKVPLDYTHGMTLFVFGDLQYGSDGFNEDAWAQFEQEFKETKNAWALGLGDYGDWLRPTMRTRLYQSLAGDDSARQQLDDMVRKFQEKIFKKMQFMEGKIIGLHSGHHEHEFASGGNSTQRLASGLRAPYLGWTASTRLCFQKKRNHDPLRTDHVYSIISTHGSSNSKHTTGVARAFEMSHVDSWVANHYVMGHACKSSSWYPGERNVVRLSGPAGVDSFPPRCMLVGGFCEGYTDGWSSSYVEKAGLKPQPISWGVIRFKSVERNLLSNLRGVSTATRVLDVEQTNRGPKISLI